MFEFEVVLEGRENSRLQNILGAKCDYPLEFPKPVSIIIFIVDSGIFKKKKIVK